MDCKSIFTKSKEQTLEMFNKMRRPLSAGLHSLADTADSLMYDDIGNIENRYPF